MSITLAFLKHTCVRTHTYIIYITHTHRVIHKDANLKKDDRNAGMQTDRKSTHLHTDELHQLGHLLVSMVGHYRDDHISHSDHLLCDADTHTCHAPEE